MRGAVIGLYALLVLIMLVSAYQFRQLQVTHDVLCIRKATLVREVEQTAAYLASDTNGDIFGIPREIIQRGQDNRKKDLAAYKILACQ